MVYYNITHWCHLAVTRQDDGTMVGNSLKSPVYISLYARRIILLQKQIASFEAIYNYCGPLWLTPFRAGGNMFQESKQIAENARKINFRQWRDIDSQSSRVGLAGIFVT